MILYSGKPNGGRCRSGAGFLPTATALFTWELVSLTERFRSTLRSIIIVQYYEPTDSGVAKNNVFYEQLNAVRERLPKGDIVIMMGDLNAEMGFDNTSFGRAGVTRSNFDIERKPEKFSIVQHDKKEFAIALVREAEDAADRNDFRNIFRITKELACVRNSFNGPVKDVNDRLLISDDEQVKNWKEHFTTVLNRITSGEIPPLVNEMARHMRIPIAPPSRREIISANNALKWNKGGLTVSPQSYLSLYLHLLQICCFHSYGNLLNTRSFSESGKEIIIKERRGPLLNVIIGKELLSERHMMTQNFRGF